jgi:hypothetical protein
MFGDLAIGDTPDVDVGPRDWLVCDRHPSEKWHCRGLVGSGQGHVVRDQVALGDQAMVLYSAPTEIVVDVGDDLLPAFAALSLWTGGVIDHVLGDELVHRRVVAFC